MSTTPAGIPIQPVTLRGQVETFLRQAIVEGRFKPGQRLIEREAEYVKRLEKRIVELEAELSSDGAQIVTGTPELADFAAALRQVAADAGAACQKSEYVVWNSQAGLEAQFRQRLTGLGYSFTVLRTVDDEGHFVSFQAKKAQGSSLSM